MSCERTQPLLADYVVGALAPEALERVEEHLVDCAVCATALGELAELEADLLALGRAPASEPAAPGAGRRRWGGLALAAGLLLGLGLGVGLGIDRSGGRVTPPPAAPRLLHGALATAAPGASLRLGRALTASKASVLDLAGGSLLEARAGSRFELIAPRQVRLSAGAARFRVAPGAAPFDVHMPHGRVRALGTIFDVEIRETSMDKTNKTVMAAGAGVAVVIAVAAGAVLVTSDDPQQPPLRLEQGQRAVATAGSLQRVRGDADTAPVGTTAAAGELQQRVREQQGRIATLERENAALAKRVRELEAGAGAAPEPRREGAAPVVYGTWGELKELKEVDWKKAAAASLKMKELLPRLLAALAKGEQPSHEVQIEIAKANQVLAQVALSINGKVPTHVSGNGEYTHPYVLGNLLAAQLEAAGERLAPGQVGLLQRLGEGYDAAWELQQKSYGESTWKLRKVLDEVELKVRTLGRFRSELSPAQQNAVVDPALADMTSVDILSPAQMLNGVARPLTVKSSDELTGRLVKVAAEQLGVPADQLEPYAGVFTTWSRAVKLDPVAQGQARFFPVQLVVQAGRAQVRALQDLAGRVGADPATIKRLRESAVVYVPRLLQPTRD